MTVLSMILPKNFYSHTVHLQSCSVFCSSLHLDRYGSSSLFTQLYNTILQFIWRQNLEAPFISIPAWHFYITKANFYVLKRIKYIFNTWINHLKQQEGKFVPPRHFFMYNIVYTDTWHLTLGAWNLHSLLPSYKKTEVGVCYYKHRNTGILRTLDSEGFYLAFKDERTPTISQFSSNSCTETAFLIPNALISFL